MDWESIGKITKTHGLKGELKFHPSIDETWIVGLKQVRLSFKSALEDFADYDIQSIRGKDRPFIIKFQGVDNLEIANNLAGQALYVSRDKFPDLPENEYYWFQVEGLKVYDEVGNYYGDVEEIIRTGSNDVYVVRDGKRELLLPMIDSVVKIIDLEARKLIFHPLEGLLEDASV
jgi:16S rRNA processing protein RimM